MAEGDEHRSQRKNLMPAFAFRHIKDLYPVFWGKARECVEGIVKQIKADLTMSQAPENIEKSSQSQAVSTAAIDVRNWASRATLDIIGVAGLGHDFGAINKSDNEISRAYRNLLRPSGKAQLFQLLNTFLPNWFVARLPLRRNNEIDGSVNIIRAMCRELIRTKKEKLAKQELTDIDILSIALESGGFGDENLVDQLMNFLAAGHETTASTMTMAIWALCVNPDIQDRLRKEIHENLPSINSKKDISSLEIDHLPYLNAVCNEVLRYYSPAPMTFRQAVSDNRILGHHVPKGTSIVIAPEATNKDISLWGPDALSFNPDRWMPISEGDKRAASGGATSNYAFMTFLQGPHSCIGQGFAKAEFACLLAAWIGRFHFELKNKQDMDEKNVLQKGGITARPPQEFWVYAKVLEDW